MFSPIVLRAVRSILRLSSGGMPKRKIARPITAMMPARAVKKVAAVIVKMMCSSNGSFEVDYCEEDGDVAARNICSTTFRQVSWSLL